MEALNFVVAEPGFSLFSCYFKIPLITTVHVNNKHPTKASLIHCILIKFDILKSAEKEEQKSSKEERGRERE